MAYRVEISISSTLSDFVLSIASFAVANSGPMTFSFASSSTTMIPHSLAVFVNS